MASIFKKAKDRTSRDKIRVASTTSDANLGQQNALDAPSEVAQAISSYIGRHPGELSFQRGDFFYVSNPVPSPDGYIEINDPIKGVRGRAPANCFKMFEKTHQRDSGSRVASQSSVGGFGAPGKPQGHQPQPPLKTHVHMPTLFGIVLYDFNAERSDELTVKTGEKLIICAHHDCEWYIAKFVDKIGEVGLVPVAYVQLINTQTKVAYSEDPSVVMQREKLPTIDQWKAIKNKHKASARPVGEAQQQQQQYLQQQQQQQQQQQYHQRLSGSPQKYRASSTSSAAGTGTGPIQRTRSSMSTVNSKSYEPAMVYPTSTHIERYMTSNNKFWYLVVVTMSNGQHRSLCRYYEDFFNYHQMLLSAWPREGGKFDTNERKERILPYIPGPVVDVTESLTQKRMFDLNDYIVSLLQLPEYISKSNLVATFFELLDGDSHAAQILPQPVRNAPPLKLLNASNTPEPLQKQSSFDSGNFSQSHQDRLSQYEPKRASLMSNKLQDLSLNEKKSKTNLVNMNIGLGSGSSSSANLLNSSMSTPPASSEKIKLKFYYKDDIFAMNIATNIPFDDLKQLVATKIDEADEPGIEDKILLLPKNASNVDSSNFDKSQVISSDSQLWNNTNFTDKGKLLVVVL